jgi:hypothetical protein
MRAKLIVLSLTMFVFAGTAAAQNQPQFGGTSAGADYAAANCSGFISDQKVPDEIRLISGEQAEYKVVFSRGDKVYVNRGQDQGVRVGDRFMVVRHERDQLTENINWFKSQNKLLKQMGTSYIDAGQVRIVNVQPKVSIGEVIFSCDYMQRGDILRPYVERPQPPYKDAAAFDHFAPVSGKPVGMVVSGRDHADEYGLNSSVYINLGSAQGVKVGDYVRMFRHQGEPGETVPQTKGYQYFLVGFGSAPAKYTWKDLPRELLGEGIVLNVSRNSSTVLVTFSSVEIFGGDYVEIE